MVTEVMIDEGMVPETTEEKQEFVPKKKNILVERHKEMCKKLNRMYEAKNKDYNSSFHDTYKQFGAVAAITRMSDKWNRILTLSKGNKPAVNNESLIDSLYDLCGYALLYIMELENDARRAERKKNEKDIS